MAQDRDTLDENTHVAGTRQMFDLPSWIDTDEGAIDIDIDHKERER